MGDAGSFGGDDGLSGYMPIAVAVQTATPGVTALAWVHANHMGVPITYSDATGAAIAQPAGYSIPGFPGQSQTTADLYYNRYRDYDPTTGRYVQADPIGLAGGANPYLYAEGNPVRYMDPKGLEIANVFPSSEPNMREAADRAYRNLPKSEQDDGYHVYGHGGPRTQCVYNRKNCMTPEQFSNWLLSNKESKYKLGQPIYLHSCDTGSLDDGFAKRLAGFMQVRVYAPTKYVWYIPQKGISAIGDDFPWPLNDIRNPMLPGSMSEFKP